uniref:uncharacterized protein LOC122590598 n=1 Tax=Erigeron canadensis TaxID=72917 RepID=UPI001CB8A080|nr:uncharacterized protein LOC122590598 [Erigeron canadensis]
MARFLSQTLIRSSSLSSSITNPLKFGSLQPNRFSSRSGTHQLHETDVESSSSSSDSEVISKKIDDIIRTIIVKESAPDWIPFVPGSSYWVPPFRKNVTEAINNVTTDFDQLLAVSSPSRGYPSSAYFLHGTLPVHPVDVNADKNRENVLQSEDEEG